MPDNQTEKTNTQTTTESTSTSTNEDPITIQKAVSGIGSPKNFLKLTVYAINVGIVILVVAGGMGLWNKFFPKKTTVVPKNMTSNLTIQSGANVGHLDVNPVGDSEGKKRIVGLQVSATSKDAGVGLVKYLNESWSVVVGGRWSYEKPDNGSQVVPEVKVQYDFF